MNSASSFKTIKHLVELRKTLHQNAELSDNEEKTSLILRNFLQKIKNSSTVMNIGGYGLVAKFESPGAKFNFLFRADMDALPIKEEDDYIYKSVSYGVSHKCGHDGHMAILCGFAQVLDEEPELWSYCNIYLLFQPSEENGKGAVRVLNDDFFSGLFFDYVFALHNLPGYPMNSLIIKDGTFASASIGMMVYLKGVSSHASEPERGNSPVLGLSSIISLLNSVPQFYSALDENVKVTVIHVRAGEIAFGTSPSEGVVFATLRAFRQDTLDRVKSKCKDLCIKVAESFGLVCEVEWTEDFPETFNNQNATEVVIASAKNLNLEVLKRDCPFAWSEDFGNFTHKFKGCLFGLGSGVKHPALHSPEYDFPDGIIEKGIDMLAEIMRNIKRKFSL